MTFVVSLFNDNVNIYEVHNNGNWYDFGFVIGLSVVFGKRVEGERAPAVSPVLALARRKGHLMGKSFEYKFVRLGEYSGSAFFGVHDKARNAYEEVVREHARDGWRLVQIFAPGVAAFGAAKYYALILERERAEDATAPTEAGRERVGSAEGT